MDSLKVTTDFLFYLDIETLYPPLIQILSSFSACYYAAEIYESNSFITGPVENFEHHLPSNYPLVTRVIVQKVIPFCSTVPSHWEGVKGDRA